MSEALDNPAVILVLLFAVAAVAFIGVDWLHRRWAIRSAAREVLAMRAFAQFLNDKNKAPDDAPG